MRKDKLRDMVRSILPSKNREAARAAKALTNRVHRRGVRVHLHHDDRDRVDLTRAASQSSNVQWRRGGDKLNHFIRWCEQITAGMTTDDALSYVRAILPRTLVGDHAYGHWERHRRPWISRFSFPRAQTAQSFIDSTTFRLRRALGIDPELHARINRSIKDRKPLDQPRRLLAGMHDIEAFVKTIVFPERFGNDLYATERSTTLELIEQTERTKGDREAAFSFYGQPTTTRNRRPSTPNRTGVVVMNSPSP